MNTRKNALYLGVGLLMGAMGSARAIEPSPSTGGEVSSVYACFYECKRDRLNQNWLEITALMLTNPSREPLIARIGFFDGNENPIAVTESFLSIDDVDELNVCETLARGTVPFAVSPAGMVEVALFSTITGNLVPDGGGYGWIKNLIGKFQIGNPEPFPLDGNLGGSVTGVGKTECRLVPPEVRRAEEIRLGGPFVQPVLIERTGE
jgi:hypothetical protein